MKSGLCVVSYLMAIVAANALVTIFGQRALPFTAFVLIPFDLLARDVLHENWKGPYLWYKMAALIIGGSALSYGSSMASAEVSFASAISFLCCSSTNAFVYHLLDTWGWRRSVRMNGSNFFAAIIDSVVFPLLAFSAIIPMLSVAQALSKFIGGFLWTALFLYLINRRAANASDNSQA